MKLENTEQGKANADKAGEATPLRAQQIDTNGAIQDLRSSTQAQDLPPVEFIISRGQKETLYFKDGSTQERTSDQKVDPYCKNSVKTPDGSQQSFDGVGLCKIRGKVNWGKSSPDGVMEITIGDKTKIQLDSRWQLLSVKSENASYDKVTEDLKIAQEKSILEHKPTIDHVGWKPLYPVKEKEAPRQAAETPARKPPQARVGETPRQWRTSVRREPADTPAQEKLNPWQTKVTRRQELGPPLDIRPSQNR